MTRHVPRPLAESPMTVGAAVEALFSRALIPVPYDTLALYERLIGDLGPLRYDAKLADLHQRALAEHPELARLMRSPEALADVAAAAEKFAHPARDDEAMQAAQARCAREAQDRYRRAVAEQIAAVDGHELQRAAAVYLVGVARAAQAAAECQAAAEAERAAAVAAEAERQAAKRAELEKLAREEAEARAAGETAEAAVRVTLENHRAARGRRIIAEIEAHGIATLRIAGTRLRGRFGQRDLVLGIPSMSMEQLAEVEAALGDEIERLESP